MAHTKHRHSLVTDKTILHFVLKRHKKPPSVSRRLRSAKTVSISAVLHCGLASLLPGALLVAIRLQALLALMLVHLKTAFLFKVAHGIWSLGFEEGKG
jgi:hypothetical protein